MKNKTTKNHETPPLHSGQLPICNGELGKIIGIYLFNEKDIVWEDGKFIRMKRIYGKYKREVYYEKREQ